MLYHVDSDPDSLIEGSQKQPAVNDYVPIADSISKLSEATDDESIVIKCGEAVGMVPFSSRGYTAPAKEAIADKIQSYLGDLIRYIDGIERGARASEAKNQEVTASTVIEADRSLREKTIRRVRSKKYKFCLIASPLTGIMTGIFGSFMLEGTPFAIAFGLSFATAVWTTIQAFGGDESR